jgi:hypothetical protein
MRGLRPSHVCLPIPSRPRFLDHSSDIWRITSSLLLTYQFYILQLLHMLILLPVYTLIIYSPGRPLAKQHTTSIIIIYANNNILI